MDRKPIPTWFFVLVIVRRGARYLLVEERDHGGGWYLPAGRVEPDETLAAAAVRETREEAGIAVTLEGIYRIQHTPLGDGYARCRVVFAARAVGDATPKSAPDEHTLSAGWFTLDEIRRLPMRAADAAELLELAGRGDPAPLALLGAEAPWGDAR